MCVAHMVQTPCRHCETRRWPRQALHVASSRSVFFKTPAFLLSLLYSRPTLLHMVVSPSKANSKRMNHRMDQRLPIVGLANLHIPKTFPKLGDSHADSVGISEAPSADFTLHHRLSSAPLAGPGAAATRRLNATHERGC